VLNDPVSLVDTLGLADYWDWDSLKAELNKPSARAIRTAIQLADLLPIPSKIYQAIMETAAFGTTLIDIAVADVSPCRKATAAIAATIGLGGFLQSNVSTLIPGTIIDVFSYAAVSTLLGDQYLAEPLVEYLKNVSKSD